MKNYIIVFLTIILITSCYKQGGIDEHQECITDSGPDSGQDTDSTTDTGSDANTDIDSDSDEGVDGGPEECNGILCNMPPNNECLDDERLLAYSQYGNCIDEVCNYEATIDLCEYKCTETDGDDYCTTDACGDCNQPPECIEDNRLISYTDGECQDNECIYVMEITQCELNCINAIEDEPAHCQRSCEGIICDDLPDNECGDPTEICEPTDTLCIEAIKGLIYTYGGICIDGICRYSIDGAILCDPGTICTPQPGDDICL